MYSFKYNQQDATVYSILYSCQCCTCFGRFLLTSSGAATVSVVELELNHADSSKLAGTYQMLCAQFLSA